MPDLPDLKPGDPLTASWLNRLKAVATGAPFDVAAPLRWMRAGGRLVLSLALPQRFAARIVSFNAGKYAWVRLTPSGTGGWVDDAQSSTIAGNPYGDPAYEYNANPNVPVGTRVDMWRTIVGDVRFFLASCNSTAQTTPSAVVSRSASLSRARPMPPTLQSRRRPRHTSTGGGTVGWLVPTEPDDDI